ncbi:hypothetical protein G3578_10575 [Brevibacillus sp. SYP-B805]|uniref:Ig-like domain-containing protein n=1 Tax=Brevibacillus sp. SYP-B805 TaxID=1578199 RepID=UPI0013EC11D1|nr:Ig-like domain-containing protein [Brevibacillus sp. SYP-B805]NGQ95598.1 hypothetical protein [Brevibacillus sp. SYP-B805]
MTPKAAWTSSNPKVAAVEKGLVTAVKEGSVAIRATYAKKTVSIPVRAEKGTSGQPVPAPTGTTYPFQDGIDSSVPAFIDLLGGELVFEGKRFTFTLHLRDMPESPAVSGLLWSNCFIPLIRLIHGLNSAKSWTCFLNAPSRIMRLFCR